MLSTTLLKSIETKTDMSWKEWNDWKAELLHHANAKSVCCLKVWVNTDFRYVSEGGFCGKPNPDGTRQMLLHGTQGPPRAEHSRLGSPNSEATHSGCCFITVFHVVFLLNLRYLRSHKVCSVTCWINSFFCSNVLGTFWVCLKIGYIPNYSQPFNREIWSLIIGFRGTLFSDTPFCRLLGISQNMTWGACWWQGFHALEIRSTKVLESQNVERRTPRELHGFPTFLLVVTGVGNCPILGILDITL